MFGPVTQQSTDDEITEEEKEVIEDKEVHFHDAVINLDALIDEIQSSKPGKHPKDVSLSGSSQVVADADAEKVLEGEVAASSEVPKGVVEKELVEKMKNFDSLNKALQSLSDTTNKMADEKCDNSISSVENCKEAIEDDIEAIKFEEETIKDKQEIIKDEDSKESDSWMSSVINLLG